MCSKVGSINKKRYVLKLLHWFIVFNTKSMCCILLDIFISDFKTPWGSIKNFITYILSCHRFKTISINISIRLSCCMLGYQSGFSPSEFLKNSPIKSLYGIMVQTRNRTEERNSNCLASEQEKLCT